MMHPFVYLLCAWFSAVSATDTIVDPTGAIPAALYPEVVTEVDRNEIKIGDEFHLSLTFSHLEEVTILEKGHAFDLGQFVIRNIEPQEPETLPGGRIQEKTVYTLATFFTGEYEIPALDIRFQTGDGNIGQFKTQPITIHVRSLTPSESEDLDIRDIKEPLLISGASRIWIVFLSLLLLGLMAFLVWYFYFRKKESLEPEAPPLPPHILALQRLAALRERTDLIEAKKFKEYSTLLSEIIRHYIEQRWFISAMDLTSYEIVEEMRPLRLDENIQKAFSDFFDTCDLIKFAKHEPQSDELNRYIDTAVDLVERTKDPMEDIQRIDSKLQAPSLPNASESAGD